MPLETHFTPSGVFVKTPLCDFWLSTQELAELVRQIKERAQGSTEEQTGEVPVVAQGE